MEKYSAFRDPGTGIQPFLPPVSPQGSKTALVLILSPLLYVLAAVRVTLVLAFLLIYLLLTRVVLLLLIPLGPIYRWVNGLITSILCRLTLFVVGVYWINVGVVKRRKGRVLSKEPWSPKAGDIVVSNWFSWIELLWLAFRFNPVFVLPIASPPVDISSSLTPTSPRTGRKTGTGSAAINFPQARTPNARTPILGFRCISLIGMILWTGHVPPFGVEGHASEKHKSLEEIRLEAKCKGSPVIVFPECTTSNGRGLLRFANVFKDYPVPTTKFRVFLMCARIDSPTAMSPTLSLAIPSGGVLNPLLHIFKISTSPLHQSLSIRLLAPSDAPSTAAFLLSDVLPLGSDEQDTLSAVCATLMGDIGRMKQVGLGWEDKAKFLDFYKSKKR